ncbi:MAG: radical SAM protein [Candidatus Omnitrophica bacterium]|nr:radical SAM protein [Candidatus Omnitrophota bacterium]
MIESFDYNKLQLRLITKAEKRTSPIKAMFELTYRCNLKCRHCYVVPPKDEERGTKELTTKEVFLILDQLAAAGCLNLGFTGGEPFLRNDIFDILRYAKTKGFNIIVLTNGTLITPKKADSLKELGLNKIDISFHASDKEIFDWFTKTPGTYKKVLNAVKLLRDRGIEVYFKATAMTINRYDMLKMRHFAVEKFGAHFRWGPVVTPSWDGRKENLKFRLSVQEASQLRKEIQKDTEIEFEKLDALKKKNRRPKNKKRRERKIDHSRLFRCGAGSTEAVINPYGEMKLCMDMPEPKYQILKGSFTEGWRVLSDYVRNTPPGPTYQCRDCELSQYCNFCPAMGWLECGDASACPPYYREMTRTVKAETEKIVERRGKR